MSLLGIKLTVFDHHTALNLPVFLPLYKSHYNLKDLHLERLKNVLVDVVRAADIWWGGKPYIRLAIDIKKERDFMTQFRATERQPKSTGCMTYLIDLCEVTNESILRFARAKDLSCIDIHGYLTDDVFGESELLKM